MVIACVMTIAIDYGLFVNLFAMNAVKATQIDNIGYKEIARIDPACVSNGSKLLPRVWV